MPVTIVATAGASNANSFVTLAEAQTYMDARLNGATWEAATTDNKNRALVEATRDISGLSYKGDRVNATQALPWPRENAPDPDHPGIDSVGGSTLGDFASNIVPQRVKDATCELAFQFIKSGTTDAAALDPTQGIISKTVDVLSTTYAEPHQRAHGLARYPRVLAYIKPLLSVAANGLQVLRT